jgi:hypothetical protein
VKRDGTTYSGLEQGSTDSEHSESITRDMIRAVYVGISIFFKDRHEFGGNPTALQLTLRLLGKVGRGRVPTSYPSRAGSLLAALVCQTWSFLFQIFNLQAISLVI